MGSMSDPRLSLVAQFDELVRNGSVLNTGLETEYWKFVLYHESCRKKWLSSDGESDSLRLRIKKLEDDNETLQTKLKHARSQIDHEIRKRQKAEAERDTVERQILLVRELLVTDKNRTILNDVDREKLAFLSTDFQTSQFASPKRNLTTIEESQSILSPSDISYDKTEDDILDVTYLRSGRKWKRPSAPPMEDEDSPPGKVRRRSKKHRRSRSAVVATTTVTVEDGDVNAQAEITADPSRHQRRNSTPINKKRGMKKYHSDTARKENAYIDSEGSDWDNGSPIPRSILKDPGYREYNNPRITPESPRLRHYNSAGRSLNRIHVFVSKTVIKAETCIPCGKKIKFGKVAMKCKDCRSVSHPDCKDQVPLPCVPSTSTTGHSKNAPGMIADYAPADPPMIPALVIHCVNEIESRGMDEVGIYRVPGSEKEVKDLKEKFLRGKGTPNLSHVDDIHTICGCLKDFLRNLKEPLVTYHLWNDFVRAAETHDRDEGRSFAYQAISELPRANRDSMAFIVLHLQRVSECLECKMPMSNLAKVFGPTVVGYSTQQPEPMQMIAETRKQQMVMETLMSISTDYWEKFMNIDENETYAREPMTPQTPEARPVLHSMLGPISTTPNATTGETSEKKSWFATPKFGSKGRSVAKKPTHFFDSPMLR